VIEDLISRVFYARNVAHFEHWRAKGEGSFAKHMSLGDFYDDVIEAVDKLVEAYQGAFSIIGNIPAPDVSERDVLKLLEADADWIEENHDAISKGNRAVGNLVDGVTDTYLTTIYKLRNLK
jgi:DNA-binding ferritin-like protein